MTYQIFTDATADLSESMMAGIPYIEVLPMQVTIASQNHTWGVNGSITAKQFYNLQRESNYASTSQINPETYRQYFEPYLQQNIDILYLCFTSGLSNTIQSAQICIRELQEKYPNQTILLVDTLCAAPGEGLLVMEAARKQMDGLSINELFNWVENHKLHVCHWFAVDVFDHLKHGGRVSATTATVATVLNIKPLLHVDTNGKLETVDKLRGNLKVQKTLIQHMKDGWMPEISTLIVIGHGDCIERAQALGEAILTEFPNADIYYTDIGPIIGAHTGPGTLALLYWGSNR